LLYPLTSRIYTHAHCVGVGGRSTVAAELHSFLMHSFLLHSLLLLHSALFPVDVAIPAVVDIWHIGYGARHGYGAVTNGAIYAMAMPCKRGRALTNGVSSG
jgi:hypothetical protein